MEPLRLRVRDFTAYEDAEVDLSSVRLACLVGPNGAGKSSLIDAILFALYGESTKGGARSLDTHIRVGAMECRVELDFACAGEVYRVVRARSRAGRSVLELYRREGDAWVPIGGKTVQETQERIERILRLDYRTFTAASVLLQGEADAFTAAATDAERKEILARILGLDLWDILAEQARERARDAVARARALRDRAEDAERRAAALPEAERRVAEIEQALEAARVQVATYERRLADAQAEVARIEAQAAQAKELEAQLRSARDEAARLAAERGRLDAERRQLRQVTAQAEAIRAAAAALPQVQADVAAMDAAQRRHADLVQRIAAAQRKADAWDADVRARIARLEAQMRDAERRAGLLARVPCAGTDLQARCELLADAREAAARVPELRAEIERLRDLENPHRHEVESLERERDAVAYDPEAHEAARAALAEVQRTAALLPALEQAERRVAEIEAREREIEERARALQEQMARIQGRLNEIASLVSAAADARRRAQESAVQLESARRREAELQDARARAMADLHAALRAREEADAAREEAEKAAREARIWSIAAEACGRKAGVPALILENAVPQIEASANAILQQVTGGRLTVRLVTQQQTKAGTISEVLRVEVCKDGVERPYHTFSGAERFLVDLAIRIAISRFLAARAGAEISLLVIDEGFASLDAGNREAVFEAIRDATRAFRKVLCVTHLEDLRDLFPQRIEVRPGARGSAVEVVA